MNTAPVGSKANPSEFDVMPRLADDEPYFVIRANDPLSSALVELHAYIGAGQAGAAHNMLAEIMALTSAESATSSFEPEISRDLCHLARYGAVAEHPSRRLGLVEPVNLGKYRKAKARADKEQRAQENRIKYGRTKAEKARDAAQSKKHKDRVDQSKLED